MAGAAGRWAEAEGLLARWLAAHPGHGEALLMLADIRIRGGRPDEARVVLERVPASSPSWSQARLALGELAIRGRRAAEAEAAFRTLAAREPDAVAPRQRLIYLLSLQQRTGEAREQLRQLARITNDPRVLVDLALQSLQDQEEVRGIGPELAEFLARTPDDPFLRRARGLELLYQGKAAEALPHLEAAADNLANDPAGRFALAECRMALGALVDADDILGPKPASPAELALWWLYHGRLDEALGNPEAAAASFSEALKLQPDLREARFRLGRVLERLGRTEEAKAHLDAASLASERRKAARRAARDRQARGADGGSEALRAARPALPGRGSHLRGPGLVEHALSRPGNGRRPEQAHRACLVPRSRAYGSGQADGPADIGEADRGGTGIEDPLPGGRPGRDPTSKTSLDPPESSIATTAVPVIVSSSPTRWGGAWA